LKAEIKRKDIAGMSDLKKARSRGSGAEWKPREVLLALLVGTYCLCMLIVVMVVCFLAVNNRVNPNALSMTALLGAGPAVPGLGWVVLKTMNRA
jgi:hypothetical protein